MSTPDSIKAAVIGLSSLELLALRDQLQCAGRCSIDVACSLEDLHESAHSYDLHIVDSATFLLHTGFLMPRKCSTLTVFRSPRPADADPPTRAIFADSSEDEIAATVDSLLNEARLNAGQLQGDLSLREKEVIRAIAEGLTNKEIADRLFISVNTVITHRKNISAKLGIRSASGMTLWAMMNGLLR